jgi:NADH dehydrogenase FAD-containing subunit
VTQQVLILGAGFGGLELARCLSDAASDEVRLVDFLSGPAPRAPFVPPSREIAAEKQAWAALRRSRWFAADGSAAREH